MCEPFKLEDLELLQNVHHYRHPFMVERGDEPDIQHKKLLKEHLLRRMDEEEQEREREALMGSDIERTYGKLNEEEKNKLIEEKKKLEEGKVIRFVPAFS